MMLWCMLFGNVANANANAVKLSKLEPFEICWLLIKFNCESKQFDVCVIYCVVRSLLFVIYFHSTRFLGVKQEKISLMISALARRPSSVP